MPALGLLPTGTGATKPCARLSQRVISTAMSDMDSLIGAMVLVCVISELW